MYCVGPGGVVSPARGGNSPLPPTEIAMYCRPATSYTAGTPSVAAGSAFSQRTLPVSWSYARSLRSDEVPTKSRPPAVTTGPPRGAWLPAAIPGNSPSGICHRMVPLFRSYAVNWDHGGLSADSPLLCVMKSYGDAYGTNPGGAPSGIAGGGGVPRPPRPPRPAASSPRPPAALSLPRPCTAGESPGARTPGGAFPRPG